MTVVVTPLSGSQKLCLHEVFASVQDSGSLSGYIRTYGFVRFSSPCSHREMYSPELNSGNETKQSFYGKYGDLPYLFDIQVNENLFRALAQFWNPAYSCFTFGKVDLVPTVEEYTALLQCPRFQCDRIYSRVACVPTFGKKLMTITGMSEQWIMARIKEKGESKCIPWGALKDLIQSHPDEAKRIDIFALSIYGLMVFPRALGYMDEATTDLFHRLSKRVTSVLAILAETFRSLNACRRASAGSFDWVPLLGIWEAIGYASLLVLRGADYKKRVSEISNAWNKTCRLQGVGISPATTPEYVEWRGRRINDNIPKPNVEGARPMEEYLQVMPSELDIMKQEFERKNLELKKKIAKLEEEKMYLSLDVDV
ncbi:hypothetical protein CXB51_023338 [Gossypium anomalum]|uniref:DUF7745 domain-containing protein n=1 Tax=Gossypium anomalum TaxID=47600 RepID=A0A8J5YQ06_9ROSI|nr:hypothetical protein CXB51_023338 [Gossypium anomalum]